ncbi:MAG: retropepsin-like aspartic protease [Pseudomonadota bacterium]
MNPAGELPRTLKLVTLWLLLGAVVFVAVQAWLAQQQRSRFSVDGASGAIELRRAADGHFHWPGSVNGIAVDFLVDTGATGTALPQALADRAGLVAEGTLQSSTAGGVVRGTLARADVSLQGGVRAERLRVTVLPRLEAPLLGMDVLSKMRFTQSDGVLRLEAAR